MITDEHLIRWLRTQADGHDTQGYEEWALMLRLAANRVERTHPRSVVRPAVCHGFDMARFTPCDYSGDLSEELDPLEDPSSTWTCPQCKSHQNYVDPAIEPTDDFLNSYWH